MGKGSGSSRQTVTQEATIPDFLQPFLTQGAGTAGRSLATLEQLLTGPSPGTRTVTNLPEGAFIQNGRVVLRETVPAQGLAPGTSPNRAFEGGFGVTPASTRLVDLGPVSQFQSQQALPGGAPSADQLIAPFSPDQELGFDLARSFAIGGDPLLTTAQQGLLSTAQGDFLAGGPGFEAALEAAQNQFVPQILSRFGSGSGLADAAIAQGTTDSFAQLFNAERARQQGAQAALPGLGLLPSQILLDIGGQQQGQAQRELSAPIEATQGLLNAALGGLPVGSLIGQTQTSQQQTSSNPFLQALGLGLTGLSFASGLGAFSPAAAAGPGLSFGATGVPAGLGSVGGPTFNPIFF